MNIKVCWMYHDIMDLYGDKGNMMVLRRRCEMRGIDITIDTLSIGDECDLSQYDLLFLGGGADKEQMILIDDLLKRKDNIKQAMDQGSFALLICGGYQLFGQYYINADNEKIEGLKFFDYYTDTGCNGTRCIGNIAIRCKLDGHDITAVGFENHGGQTMNVTTPLGEVLSGCGNSFDAKREGFYNGQVLATYMHGPLLPKNPEIADFVIYKSLKKRNPEFNFEDLTPLDDELENKAKIHMLKRMDIQ
ncbi:type 1 glutamine amidotransferase [Amedibacillus sp. YH-ame10]